MNTYMFRVVGYLYICMANIARCVCLPMCTHLLIMEGGVGHANLKQALFIWGGEAVFIGEVRQPKEGARLAREE